MLTGAGDQNQEQVYKNTQLSFISSCNFMASLDLSKRAIYASWLYVSKEWR